MDPIQHIAEQGAPPLPTGPGQPDFQGLAAELAPMFAVGLIAWHALRAFKIRAAVREKARERGA